MKAKTFRRIKKRAQPPALFNLTITIPIGRRTITRLFPCAFVFEPNGVRFEFLDRQVGPVSIAPGDRFDLNYEIPISETELAYLIGDPPIYTTTCTIK